MRMLSFMVDGDTIVKDPTCDFRGLSSVKDEFVKAKFTFSEEWAGAVIVLGITSFRYEYDPIIVGKDGRCQIPTKVFQRSIFDLQLFGRNREVRLKTNPLKINQNGGAR